MNRLLRRVFRLKKKEDIGRMLVELYRHIGIRLDGQVPGRLCFRACYFSQYYTPAVCLAAPMEGARQDRQLLMPFVSRRQRYIISPYMDWLSFFFNKEWRRPMDGMVSLMIKLADTEQGDVHDGHMQKTLTAVDHQYLKQGVEDCREILLRMGVREQDIFLGSLNAGHPGGMLPLTEAEAQTLHSPLLPANLYVADATILPQALGLPPILTIMALAKRIAKNIINHG